jgi:hypothetical protein
VPLPDSVTPTAMCSGLEPAAPCPLLAGLPVDQQQSCHCCCRHRKLHPCRTTQQPPQPEGLLPRPELPPAAPPAACTEKWVSGQGSWLNVYMKPGGSSYSLEAGGLGGGGGRSASLSIPPQRISPLTATPSPPHRPLQRPSLPAGQHRQHQCLCGCAEAHSNQDGPHSLESRVHRHAVCIPACSAAGSS